MHVRSGSRRYAAYIALALITVVVVLSASGASSLLGAKKGSKPGVAGGQLEAGLNRAIGKGVSRSNLGAVILPANSAMWGAWVAPVNGQTSAQAVAGLETLMGRPLDIVHQYEAFDDVWPTATQTSWANGGRIILANVSARQKSGSILTWTAVANGSQDSTIDALAGRLKTFGHQVYISFDEEPESRYHDNPATYTLASFVAAFKHLHDRMAADGVTNVSWVWNVTGYIGNASIFPSLYPGDSYVDWIAWDPYNWYNCSVNTTNKWESFDTVIQPFYDWIAGGHLSPGAATKPLMLAEYGTVEHSVTPTKGQWFTDAVSTLPSRPLLKAIVYYDENKDCNWPITTSASSITGFAAASLNCYVYSGGPCSTALTVSSVLPNKGPAAGGTSVVITGIGLTGATAVKFGSVTASTFTVTSDTKITATSPPGSGTADIRVTVGTATTATSAADRFTYTVNCVSTALNSDKASPQPVGVPVTLSATSTGCGDPSPLYRFYIRSLAGVWTIVRNFSASSAFQWNTSSYAPGIYLTVVWVKDAKSTRSYDAYALGTFTLQLARCSSANMSSDVSSPQPSGTTVTFTATSVGCPTPLYQWWFKKAGVWTIIPGHDFAHSSSTYAWNTTGLADGTYQIGVWAKQQYSQKAHDAYAFNTYTLVVVSGTTRCQAANIGVSPPSPSLRGTTVTLTATAFSCDNAQYRWWVKDTLGVWAIVQDYPTGSNTFTWATTSRSAGIYLLGVWVRQAGSTSSYEASGYLTFTLTAPPAQSCSSVNLAPDVVSPQSPGATVTFTAVANGCNSPTYQFLVLAPGGTWTIVKAFSASNSYTWNTAGLRTGIWRIGVWAKQAGSTARYESFAIITFQLLAAA
jgi:hypothetical protein